MRQALASALPPESPAEVEQLRAKVVQLEAEIASLRRPVPVMPVAAPSVPSGSVAFLGADLGSLRQVEPLGVRQRLSALAQSFTASRATFVKVLLVVLCAGVVGFASMRAYLPSAPAASQPPAPAQTQTQTEKAAALTATAPAAVASNPPEVETQPVPGGEVRLVRMTGQSSPSGRAGHFYLGETEVTRRLWQAVAQLPAVRQELPPEPWRKGRRVGPEGPDCSACPATAVSWQATQEFIARLNALPGNRFTWRLPTAAEWVAACGECRLQEDSNIRMTGDGPAFVRPVKSGSANEFGLYDMYGNVWEWCQDQAAHDAERREIRGGSFRRQDAWANTEEDYEGYPDGGFRLAATR
jgi:formylglycine-generating enzyme required for sulfatase activity